MPLLDFRRKKPLAWERSRYLPLVRLSDLAQAPREANEAAIRALCTSAYLGDETSLCRILGRYKLLVDTNDLYLSLHLLIDGYWEMWLTEVIARTVKPGMVVADIGANLGYFSVLMADLVGAGGKVHAFEPNPAIATRLSKSLLINGYAERSTVHQQALGEVEGAAMQMMIPDGGPGGTAIWPAGIDDPRTSPVTVRRMDAIDGMDAVELVKIDAEGSEPAIWAGMTRLLAGSKLRTAFIEFTACHYADPAGFLEALAAPGFTLHKLDPFFGLVPASAAETLALPSDKDVLLVLTR